jgi:hypothetical protein
VAFLGTVTLGIGIWIGKIRFEPNSQQTSSLQQSTLSSQQALPTLSDFEKIFLPLSITSISLTLLSFANSRISNEIEEELENQSIQFQKQLNERDQGSVKQYESLLKDEIANLKVCIESTDLPKERRDQIRNAFNKIEYQSIKFEVLLSASREIAKWLDSDRHRLALRDYALKTSHAKDLPRKTKEAFDEDICEFINWLRHSIVELHPFRVSQERYASAIEKGLVDGYPRYKIALEAIKEYVHQQNGLRQYFGKTTILEEMIAYFLNELKNIVEGNSTPSHNSHFN